MYGKIVNGELVFAPSVLRVEDRTIFNPGADLLEADGYKLVVYTNPIEVEDGYYAMPKWTEEEDKIVQGWISKILLKEEKDLPVWDVWQGKRFEIGDECIVEGKIFRVKVSHAASWNKRPLTGVDWEDYFEEVK